MMGHVIVCICRMWVGIKKLLLLVDAAKQVISVFTPIFVCLCAFAVHDDLPADLLISART